MVDGLSGYSLLQKGYHSEPIVKELFFPEQLQYSANRPRHATTKGRIIYKKDVNNDG